MELLERAAFFVLVRELCYVLGGVFGGLLEFGVVSHVRFSAASAINALRSNLRASLQASDVRSSTLPLSTHSHTGRPLLTMNPDGGSWTDCMRRDIAALMDCDTVARLPGWHTSKGAQLEVLIAEHLGMPVVNAHDLVSMEIAG